MVDPPSDRVLMLEMALKELGLLVSDLSCGGKYNPSIREALERARVALRHSNKGRENG